MKGKKNHHRIILGYLLDPNLKSHKICSVSWMVVHFISVDNLHVMIIRDFGVLLFTSIYTYYYERCSKKLWPAQIVMPFLLCKVHCSFHCIRANVIKANEEVT